MFIARVHIGTKFMPGDRLPDDMPEETLNWLTAAGAIIEREDEAEAAAPAEAPVDIPAEAAAPETPSESEEGDEYDDAPEIDVMAGIVKDGASEKAPTRKPRTTGNRKAKGGKNA